MSILGKNLSFGYTKDSLVFERVDIEIGHNEVLGLQGYSGSGKTTLGKVLAGYLPSYTGTIEIDGQPYTHKTKGYHPVQIIHQHPEKSINPRWKMKEVMAEVEGDLDELMDTFGIQKEWLNRWPIELSGGELQRFCIARAFDKRTHYLIADEITTMLDGIVQAEIWKNILYLCKKKKIGLMVVSHDCALLEKLCHRIIDFESLRSKG